MTTNAAPDPMTLPVSVVPCCPELGTQPVCDVLDFHYRLIHNVSVTLDTPPTRVPQMAAVEVLLHIRLERCTGPLTLGDLVYSTTLLPGEKVRLFTTDRRTRFTYDSESKISYRSEQTSEEQFYMASMSDSLSDVSVRDLSHASNTSQGSAQGHGGTSGAIQSFLGGASVDVSGSYNASSTGDFLHQLSQHASASSHRAEMGARTASAVSVGEVQSRTHTAGESEDHFESASREFANPNRCHAVTFYFYRINKTQTIRLTLESVTRRVIDPAADSRVTNNPFVSKGDVAAIPNGVLATAKDRLEVERIGRSSVAAQEQEAVAVGNGGAANARRATDTRIFGTAGFPAIEPLSPAFREQALRRVDEEMVKGGLLAGVGGNVSPEAQTAFQVEIQTTLPTAGLLVKGCLDDCNICEDALMRDMELDLTRKDLQNKLLQRQIDLLDKAQEYRCCPPGEDEAA